LAQALHTAPIIFLNIPGFILRLLVLLLAFELIHVKDIRVSLEVQVQLARC